MTGAVLVTGAGARLGKALALRFAREGRDIALHYNTADEGARKVAEAIRGMGREAVLLQADLGDSAACATLMDRAVDALPHLDGLVNSASVFERDSLATMEPEFLRDQMRVNADAPLFLGQAFWRRIAGQGWILNLIDAKIRQITPEFFSYTLSKLAVEDVTRMLAMACAPQVRVNAIAPGLVLRSGAQSDADFERVHDLNPLKHGPRVEDICDMAVTLADARATTGQIVAVDGGRHFYSPGHPQNT